MIICYCSNRKLKQYTTVVQTHLVCTEAYVSRCHMWACAFGCIPQKQPPKLIWMPCIYVGMQRSGEVRQGGKESYSFWISYRSGQLVMSLSWELWDTVWNVPAKEQGSWVLLLVDGCSWGPSALLVCCHMDRSKSSGRELQVLPVGSHWHVRGWWVLGQRNGPDRVCARAGGRLLSILQVCVDPLRVDLGWALESETSGERIGMFGDSAFSFLLLLIGPKE